LKDDVGDWSQRVDEAQDLLDDLARGELSGEAELPVTQKTQPMAQPAWVETQMVLRPGRPSAAVFISTASISWPSWSRSSSFEVRPSVEVSRRILLAARDVEARPQRQGDIGHLVGIEDAPPMQPMEDLACPIGWLAPAHHERGQLVREQGQQRRIDLGHGPNYATLAPTNPG